MVFVRHVEIPQYAVEEFGSIMGVQKVPVTSLNIDGEARIANLLGIRASAVGRIV
jgi:hypothetical protein